MTTTVSVCFTSALRAVLLRLRPTLRQFAGRLTGMRVCVEGGEGRECAYVLGGGS